LIAVDTNLLVRILIDDPGQPEQVTIARSIARQARHVFVPQIVERSRYRGEKPSPHSLTPRLIQ